MVSLKLKEHRKRFEQLNDAALKKKIDDDIAKEDDQEV